MPRVGVTQAASAEIDDLKPTRVYLGVDPGASGGLAEIGITGNGRRYVKTTPMPTTERDLWDWFHERYCGALDFCDQVYAVIEQVGGYLTGGEGNTGSTMFKFGQSYGCLRGMLVAASIPFEEVTPQKWQKALGVPGRGKGQGRSNETKSQFKARLRGKAQQLFPSLKVTLATADALLLAEYCQRYHEGLL